MRHYPNEWETALRRDATGKGGAWRRYYGESRTTLVDLPRGQAKSSFRPAAVGDYLGWLLARRELRPEEFRCVPFAEAGWVVAVADFRTHGEVGEAARTIIVPKGVRHLGGDIGDNVVLPACTCAPDSAGRCPEPPPGFSVPMFTDREFVAAGYGADAEHLIADLGVPVDELREVWQSWDAARPFGAAKPSFSGHPELQRYYRYLASTAFARESGVRLVAETADGPGDLRLALDHPRPAPEPLQRQTEVVEPPRRLPRPEPPRRVLGVDTDGAIGVAAILSLAILAAAMSHDAMLVALASIALVSLLVVGKPVARRALNQRRAAKELSADLASGWDTACAERDAVTVKWTEFLFPSGADGLVSAYIDRPLLGDMSEPLSAAFIEAFNEMNALHTDDPKARADRARMDSFSAAVRSASTAFAAADANARSKALRGVVSGGHQMTDAERKHVERAGALIRQALGSDSPAESRAALAKAAELLSSVGFVRASELPEAARACIEGSVAREAITDR